MSLDATKPPPVPLDYSPAPPARRKWIRRLTALFLLLALVTSGWRWGPTLWRQAQTLYWQRQCLNDAPAPNQVVYEEDFTAAARLLSADSRYAAYPLNRTSKWSSATTGNAAAFQPQCWQHFVKVLPTRPLILGMRSGGAVIFLHERISPAGHHRLVMVRYFPGPKMLAFTWVAGFNYEPNVIAPATWRGGPAWVGPRIFAYSTPSARPRIPPHIRVYAGQPDPKDSSHFTIRYEMWGRTDVIDGYLRDDDCLTLKPRKMPTMPR